VLLVKKVSLEPWSCGFQSQPVGVSGFVDELNCGWEETVFAV